MQLRIGIYVTDNWEYLHSTVQSLTNTRIHHEIVIIIDSKAIIPDDLPEHIENRIVLSKRTVGEAGAFNSFLESGYAEAYLWVENGAIAAPGAADILWHALQDSEAGLAGPSTNSCWNEQGIAEELPNSTTGFNKESAAGWTQEFDGQMQTLAPLYSLNCFCLMLTDQTVKVIGAADENFANQPCWEMDYNIRAARAGIDGIWVKSALVWRMPRQFKTNDATLLQSAKRRYQDKHCSLQKKDGQPYHEHCKGDVCKYFAIDTEIKISLAPMHQSNLQTSAICNESTDPVSSRITSDTIEITPHPNSANAEDREFMVSCILPTNNRGCYLPMAIKLFLKQDYEEAELVIVDDGSNSVQSLIPDHPRIKYYYLKGDVTLGEKRNICCDLAKGQIILHWDDDDWFAYWRISYQVAHLLHSGKSICGINQMYYADPKARKAWLYALPQRLGSWIAGGSFCFHKSFWQHHRFPALNDGEDTSFITQVDSSDILTLERFDFYVGRVHSKNTSEKKTNEILWHSQPMSTIESIIGEDFESWAS